MSTLTMPIADAILAAKALLNHASKDDTTPVIMQAGVVEHDGKTYLTATDRYSFGRFMLGAADIIDGEVVGMMIPRDALTWVSKIVPKNLRRGWQSTAPIEDGGYGLRFTWSEHPDAPGRATPIYEVEVAIVHGEKTERSQMFDVHSGNFPPVARLWREGDTLAQPTDCVALSHTSLSKIAADIVLFEGKDSNASARLHLHAPDGKPGPVQYTLGTRWTAAVQPNLLTR